MRIQAALPAALLILFVLPPLALFGTASCGGGEAKAAFERYDAAVSPLLDEEHEVWREFAEMTADAMHYGLSEKIGAYIRGDLVPFHAKMAERVDAIVPEGEELTRIHGFLVRYVKLREEFLNVFEEMEALDRRANAETQPARDRLAELTKVVAEKGEAIQPAFVAAPEFAANVRESLGQVAATSQQFQQKLVELEQGTVPSAGFLQMVDSQALPWFRQTKKEIAALGATGPGKDLQTAVIDYITAIEALVEASRSLAQARSNVEKQGGPVQLKLRNLRGEGDRTLQVFKEEALAYRNRLR